MHEATHTHTRATVYGRESLSAFYSSQILIIPPVRLLSRSFIHLNLSRTLIAYIVTRVHRPIDLADALARSLLLSAPSPIKYRSINTH